MELLVKSTKSSKDEPTSFDLETMVPAWFHIKTILPEVLSMPISLSEAPGLEISMAGKLQESPEGFSASLRIEFWIQEAIKLSEESKRIFGEDAGAAPSDKVTIGRKA